MNQTEGVSWAVTAHSRDPLFNAWMRDVNVFLVRLCGLGIEDLPDWNYRDAYEADVSPVRAAKRVIQAAKDY